MADAGALVGPVPNIVEISLRLMRGSTAEEALKDDHDFTPMPSSIGQLYFNQSGAHPPGWVNFLEEIAPAARDEFRTQSCSAVLFVETKHPAKRLFAICFGQGHHALADGAVETGFGLKVTLNLVSRDRLRVIDSAQLDSTVMQKRTQASRNADLGAFEVDTDRDLVRLASGIPSSSDFAKALTGRDALKFRAHLAPTRIVAQCERALELYGETSYQRDFGFIDHVQPVSSRTLIQALDDMVFEELKILVDGGVSDLHLAIPDILGPEDSVEIGYFGLGLSSGKESYLELAIEHYVSELRKGKFDTITDMRALKPSHEIRVMKNGRSDGTHRRKLYSCFVFETSEADNSYVLFDGIWYLIEDKFQKDVERSYQALLKPSFLTKTEAKTEQALIAELIADQRLLCLDQTRSNPAGAPTAKIEACDFLSRQSELIHLKDGHSSSPLSHLWNQALISAEAFMGDSKFRGDFRRAATKREVKYNRQGFAALIPDGRTRPTAKNFTVIYGVMRHAHKKSKNLNLPFFSKVALRAAAARIDRMGFNVQLHLIEKV